MPPAASADPVVRLAARDAGLPGLEAVLDGDRFAELVDRRLPGLGIRGAEPRYVRYKPATACVVAHRLRLADRDADAYVLLQRPESLAKLVKHVARANAPGELGPGAVLLPPLTAALYPHPNDRRVRALPLLADPVRRRRLLQRALPERPELWDAELSVLRRKPERRVVATLGARNEEVAVVKAHAADFTAANRAAKLLGGADEPRMPLRLGRSRTLNVVISEWLPGRPLGEAIAGEPEAAGVAGAALAALHRRPADGLHAVGAFDEAHRLSATARLVGRLLPERRVSVARLARQIAMRLPVDGAPVLRHGDFSPDQVVVDAGRAGLLDLDEAVLGDPVADLGSFCAALARDAVCGPLDDDRAAAATDAFLAAYAHDAGAVDEGALRTWTAAAILRLAPEPFRHGDPRWPDRIDALVARAEAVHGP